MSKTRIIVWVVIVVILLGGGFLIQQRNSFANASSEYNTGHLKVILSKPNDGLQSIPEDIREYFLENEDKKVTLKYDYETPYAFRNNAKKEKNIDINNEFKPSNYDKYKTDFCEYVLTRVKEPKEKVDRSVSEMEKLPSGPNMKAFRYTGRLWAHVSTLLDFEGKDTESLLTAHAIFYAARDIVSEYQRGQTLLNSTIGLVLQKIASQQLLRWASKPRPKSAKESKLIAKDILELLKTEQPLYKSYEVEYAISNSILDYCAKHGNILALITKKSSYFKSKADYYYGFAKPFENKPFYEYREDVKKISDKFMKELEEHSHTRHGIMGYVRFFFSPFKTFSDDAIYNVFPHSKGISGSVAEKDDLMGMTAIALAYNSFQAEKGHVPNSMKELEEWFGEKFPESKLNDTAYKFNEKEGCVLYNDGVNGVHEGLKKDFYDRNDDLYFRFIQ